VTGLELPTPPALPLPVQRRPCKILLRARRNIVASATSVCGQGHPWPARSFIFGTISYRLWPRPGATGPAIGSAEFAHPWWRTSPQRPGAAGWLTVRLQAIKPASSDNHLPSVFLRFSSHSLSALKASEESGTKRDGFAGAASFENRAIASARRKKISANTATSLETPSFGGQWLWRMLGFNIRI
jgi:hypothetical protein